LRPTLRENEPVAFYSSRDKKWLEAKCSGKQKSLATKTGYKIELLETSVVAQPGTIIPSVPGAKLRRRYPVGSIVDIFRGTVHGWCQAVIIEVIGEDPDAGSPIKSKAATHTTPHEEGLPEAVGAPKSATAGSKNELNYFQILEVRYTMAGNPVEVVSSCRAIMRPESWGGEEESSE